MGLWLNYVIAYVQRCLEHNVSKLDHYINSVIICKEIRLLPVIKYGA